MRDIPRRISFGLGRCNNKPVDHELFDSPLWAEAGLGHLKDLARAQLGTVGVATTNLDLFEDDTGWVWIGVHFGSRGLGHGTATHFLKLAGGRDGTDVAPALVDPETELGTRYLAGMELAGRYASAGREWVVDRVGELLGPQLMDMVHNHHNFAWRARHGDRMLWVVRKGATPAFPGQRGFVGGSMGDDAVIIRGVDGERSSVTLFSSVHGSVDCMGAGSQTKVYERANERLDRGQGDSTAWGRC